MNKCKVKGCKKPMWGYKEYCPMHRLRLSKYGNVNFTKNRHFTDQEVLNFKSNFCQVIKRLPNHRVECLCKCGKVFVGVTDMVMSGNTKSCGCRKIEWGKSKKTHGMTKSSEYRSYFGAKNRCINLNCDRYENYGGRGIKFLFNSFEEFYKELGSKPSTKHSVDRINVNGNYEIGNVKWSLNFEQARNTTCNRWVVFRGETKIITDWIRELKIPETSYRRFRNKGLSDIEIFNKYIIQHKI